MLTQADLTLRRQQIEVDIDMVCRLPSFGKALDMCQAIGNVTDKEVCAELEIDTSTWSRIKQTGDPDYGGQTKYFPHHRLIQFMNLCGNRIPLIWLEHQHGDDPRTIRRYQTEAEARAEAAEARARELEQKLATISEFMKGAKA